MRRSSVTLAALLLGGCGVGGDTNASGQEIRVPADAISEVTGLQAGQWELTSQVVGSSLSSEGLAPGAQLRTPTAESNKLCLTPLQMDTPGLDFLTGGAVVESRCDAESLTISNGRVSGTIVCPGSPTMRTQLDGRYTATTYDVTQRSVLEGQGMRVTSEIRTSGRHTGPCRRG